MKTLSEADAHFKAKKATHFSDSLYPPKLGWNGQKLDDKIFSRHYFRNGVEIGYALPDFLDDNGNGLHEFETFRMWHMPHTLHELV